uniref:hypothetical protein n=1 Tax=Roseivirga sp. TaxID=1964215 RepID=UPI004048181B
MENNTQTTENPQYDAKLPVMASAFVVWVNHKCIVVVAKTKEEVMDRLREAGIEWNSIKVEPLDAIFPHLP